jgi:hypothetical protein
MRRLLRTRGGPIERKHQRFFRSCYVDGDDKRNLIFMEPTPPIQTSPRQLEITFKKIRDSDMGTGASMCWDVFMAPQNGNHSRVIHLWDALPKYSFSHTLNVAGSGKYTREWASVIISRDSRITLRVTITAAILESDKMGKNRVVFPGQREEMVERVLRYLAVKGMIEFCPDQSPKQVSGPTPIVSVASLQGEYAILPPPMPLMFIARVQRIHDNDARATLYQARFHPLASRMLYKGCFHPVNYERVMALKLPLARWIADRVVMRFRQAEPNGWNGGQNPFGYRLTRRVVRGESGVSQDEPMRYTTRRIKEALRELVKAGFLENAKSYTDPKTTRQTTRGGRRVVTVP